MGNTLAFEKLFDDSQPSTEKECDELKPIIKLEVRLWFVTQPSNKKECDESQPSTESQRLPPPSTESQRLPYNNVSILSTPEPLKKALAFGN